VQPPDNRRLCNILVIDVHEGSIQTVDFVSPPIDVHKLDFHRGSNMCANTVLIERNVFCCSDIATDIGHIETVTTLGISCDFVLHKRSVIQNRDHAFRWHNSAGGAGICSRASLLQMR
jgi:hypothetical protein